MNRHDPEKIKRHIDQADDLAIIEMMELVVEWPVSYQQPEELRRRDQAGVFLQRLANGQNSYRAREWLKSKCAGSEKSRPFLEVTND